MAEASEGDTAPPIPDLTCEDPPQSGFGYGTKTHLAICVDEHVSRALYGDTRYAHWISSEANPTGNPDASNPLMIFRELDQAVKEGREIDKMKTVKAALAHWAFVHLGGRHDELEVAIRRLVGAARTPMFRPYLWKVPRTSWYKFVRDSTPGMDAMYTTGYVLSRGRDFEYAIQ